MDISSNLRAESRAIESPQKKIEELEKTEDELIEEVLHDIMPKAFAVVKETARRWTNNGFLKVKAKKLYQNLQPHVAVVSGT